jgi:hypothetical protein
VGSADTDEGDIMPHRKGRSWKLERASVHVRGKSRPRSNKYCAVDSQPRPAPGTRERVWVGGYVRSDGTKVRGHYRAAAQ